ncbi:MAG: TolC family protein [Elusimicrobiaceae bacterium]|nr:TolC family protein [Elusimicrobiaceae bacterium]
MKNIKILTAILILPWLGAAAGAEIVTDALTWTDCVEAALRGNPSLYVSKYGKEADEYAYRAALNGYLPQLSLGYSGTRSGEPGSSNWRLGLSASETLFSAQTGSSIRIKRATVKKDEVALLGASASARYQLRAAFVNLIYAQENIDVLTGIHKLRASNAEMIRMRYEGGRESKGNMMRSSAQAEKSRLDIVNAARNLVSARRELMSAMGMDEYREFTASGALADLPAETGIDVNAAALANPDVKVNALALEIAKEQVTSAASALFPTLSASQSVNWSGDSMEPKDRSWSAGVALNLPIFSNGITYVYNNVKSARSQVKQSEETYRKTLLSVRTDLQLAQATLEQAHDNMTSSKLFLAAAEQRHKEATVQYLNGALSFDIWEGVEQELVSAQQDYLSALKSVNIAKAALEKLLGAPLSD